MTEATVSMDGKNGKGGVSVVDNKPGCMDGLADRMNSALTGAYFTLGYNVGKRPRTTVALALLLCIILSAGIGYPGLKNESRGDKLWVPGNTQAQADKRYVDSYFGADARFGEVIIKKAGGGDVLDPAVFAGVATLVNAIQATSIMWQGENITWDKQCLKFGPNCFIEHVLEVFAAPADYDTRAKIVAKVNTVPAPVSVATGRPINVDSVLGGVVRDPATGAVTAAAAIKVSFLTKLIATMVNGDEEDLRGDEYEQQLLNLFRAGVPGLTFNFVLTRSFSDEFGEAIQGDLALLQAAFMLILAYASLMISRWDQGCVGSRVGLTFSGVVSIGMAIASSYGVCSYLGLFYSPLMNVLPFLLLGVGVDDMFVIVNSYDLVDPARQLDLPTRIGRTLASAGASITVTSMTDVFAFLIGSNTTLPALRNFCFYAAFGIFFDFLYQITWFVAFLTLDEWRRTAKRADCGCCCSVPDTACCMCCAPAPSGKTRMQTWMGESLGGALTKKWVKAVVVVAFAALAGVGLAGCAMMEVQADVNDFFPPGSYVKDWIEDSNTLFRGQGESIAIYTRDTPVNTAQGTSLLLASSAAFKADPYVVGSSVSSWSDEFNIHRNSTGAYAYAELYAWLNGGGGASFRSDVVWKNETNNVPNEGIVTTRIRGNHVQSDKSNDSVKAMDSLRNSLRSVPANGGAEVFAYSGAWLNYEQYKAIEVEAIRNVGSSIAVMGVIIAILLVNPTAVLVVFFCLVLIILNIVGFMHFWGLTIDSVTVIMLVIALGLSVDYSAHIGRAYMEIQGTPNERLKRCLGDMGVAVFNGAFSTFLAVLMLSGSQSYVFLTFFRQLFLCISFGLAHGLILLPVLMSLAAPNAYTPGAHVGGH